MNEYVPYGNTFILIWNVFIHITLHSFWSRFPHSASRHFQQGKGHKGTFSEYCVPRNCVDTFMLAHAGVRCSACLEHSRTRLSNKRSWKCNATDNSNTCLTLCVKAFSCKEGQATSLTTIQYY